MNRILLASCSLALAAGSLAWSQKDAAKPASKLDQLAWLAAGWMEKDGEIEEHWIAPKGGLMLGCGRTVVNGKAREFEFLRIEERENGDVFYVAQPGGRPATEFKLVASGGEGWVFENPEHDFPRTIQYERTSGGMNVTLGGVEDGRARELELWYERVR
jgi:hypothetical protein